VSVSGRIAVVPVSGGVRSALLAVMLVAIAGIAVAVGQTAIPWQGDTPQFLVLAGLNAFLALFSASAFQHRWAVIRDDFDRQVRNVYLPIGLHFVLRLVLEALPIERSTLAEIDRISWTGSQALAAGFLVFTLRSDISSVGARIARTLGVLALAATTGAAVLVLQNRNVAVPLQPIAVGLVIGYLIAAMMPLVGGRGKRLQREILLGAAFLLTAGAHADLAWSQVVFDSPYMWGHILLAISLAVPFIGATHENVTLIVSEARMARRIRRTRWRTELLLDTLPTLVLTVDSDHRLRYANRSAVALLELATRREDGPGRGWLQHFDAQDRPGLLATVDGLLEVGESASRSEMVIRAVDHDGGLHWLQCQLYVVVDPVEDDPLVELVGTDITDLTLARRTGEVRQNRLALLSNLAQTVAGEVAEERILGRIREMLGEIVPVTFLLLYRPQSDGSHLVIAASSNDAGEDDTRWARKIDRGDDPCWRAFEDGFLIQTAVSPADDAEGSTQDNVIHLPLLAAGQVVGVLCMVTTDRPELSTDQLDLLTQAGILVGGSVYLSQLIRELEEQRAIAIEASHLKSEFLANTSHELRTPLTSILGFLRLIIDGAVADTDKQREFLVIAHESAEKLLTIINDVLDLAKIEAGRLEVHLAPSRSSKILSDIEALFCHQMRSKGLRFEVEQPPSEIMLWADPHRTIQILTNVLSNALKFTPRGGTVRVSVEGHRPIVRFLVRDSGIGIPPEELDKVFASFYQIDGSTTRHFGGTGLGLAISRRLASLMGGNLELTSTGRGHGVTAVLDLCQFTGEEADTHR